MAGYRNTYPASPYRLRSGEWGIKTTHTEIEVGDIVTVTTSRGDSWDKEVTRVIWKNDAIALCKTASPDSSRGCRSDGYDDDTYDYSSDAVAMTCMSCGRSASGYTCSRCGDLEVDEILYE